METLTETIDRMLKEREAKKLFPFHITLVDLKNERAKIDEEELKTRQEKFKVFFTQKSIHTKSIEN